MLPGELLESRNVLVLREALDGFRDRLRLIVVDMGPALDLLHVLEGWSILSERLSERFVIDWSTECLNSSLLLLIVRIKELERRRGVLYAVAVDL